MLRTYSTKTCREVSDEVILEETGGYQQLLELVIKRELKQTTQQPILMTS